MAEAKHNKYFFKKDFLGKNCYENLRFVSGTANHEEDNLFNPFACNGIFLYPLKISEKNRVS